MPSEEQETMLDQVSSNLSSQFSAYTKDNKIIIKFPSLFNGKIGSPEYWNGRILDPITRQWEMEYHREPPPSNKPTKPLLHKLSVQQA